MEEKTRKDPPMIADKIYKVRTQKGLTPEQFAKSLNISPEDVIRIEQGTLPVSDRMLHTICDEFFISEAWLRDIPFPDGIQDQDDRAVLEFAYRIISDPDLHLLKDAALLLSLLPAETLSAVTSQLNDLKNKTVL